MIRVGLLVRVHAKPGKEAEAAQFLADAQAIVEQEPDTRAWFAVQFDASTFGIFDVFDDDAGRQTHLAGGVGTELAQRADELFTAPPAIENVDVLASKIPS
ncbi:antibiotic biosynthesis monooxygenase [Mycolicibacterium sp. 141076]|uniref:putative quinol monooxygenase n=1 Tax=Mycolicibacterium sp. 141076 TaxID=3090599 RepID=UPI00299EA59F|nr:antibiotic biosynthesis monooxygenase [Mycolicibacterium sp. 141076]MDX1878023.1 antibiotic biosynthesis monooxygenase [Mycolicibacterium sp. 141076]